MFICVKNQMKMSYPPLKKRRPTVAMTSQDQRPGWMKYTIWSLSLKLEGSSS